MNCTLCFLSGLTQWLAIWKQSDNMRQHCNMSKNLTYVVTLCVYCKLNLTMFLFDSIFPDAHSCLTPHAALELGLVALGGLGLKGYSVDSFSLAPNLTTYTSQPDLKPGPRLSRDSQPPMLGSQSSPTQAGGFCSWPGEWRQVQSCSIRAS